MGTWGLGAFDNDDAADWVWDLERSTDLQVVVRALTPPPGYLETPDATLVMAAAEIVAAAGGHPHARLPPRVSEWIQKQAHLDFVSLVSLARTQVHRLLSSPNEWAELWDDSGQRSEWESEANALLTRLEFQEKE